MTVDTLIVGGGIGGLTAAWRLAKAGRDVMLVEASDHVGGAVRTVRREGFLLEQGPFNVIVRAPALAELLADVADAAPVIPANKAVGRNRFVLFDGRLRKVPGSPVDLAKSDLLTAAGKARLLRGLAWSSPSDDAEETVDAAARRRFGPEVADRVVSAVTTGIYAADSKLLSLAACFPSVAAWDETGHSPLGRMLGRLAKRKPTQPDRPRGLISVAGGLGAVPEALAARLGAERVRVGCSVERVERIDRGFTVSMNRNKPASEPKAKTRVLPSGEEPASSFLCEAASGEEIVECRNLILSVGASAAAALMDDLAPDASQTIRRMTASSMVVLNLAYRAADVGHALDGYGFLVPHTDADCPLLGVLFADSVFPHHAPAGVRLLRAFVGGTRDPAAIHRPDGELIDRTTAALREILGVCGGPALVDLVRWPDAVPLYAPGHVGRVETIRRAAAAVPGLHLLGNYLAGVSVNDVVRRAAEVADSVSNAPRRA